MIYDQQGNLVSSTCRIRNRDGLTTVIKKEAQYERIGMNQSRLVETTEMVMDPLGNKYKKVQKDMRYENGYLSGYLQIDEDSYGRQTQRHISNMNYDSLGRLVQYHELRTGTDAGRTERLWRADSFVDNPAYAHDKKQSQYYVHNYHEYITDQAGGRYEKIREHIQYDRNGRILSYNETIHERMCDGSSRSSRNEWSDGQYDEKGRLIRFRERGTDALGRVSERLRKDMSYDINGRVVSYREESSDDEGNKTYRIWNGVDYNSQNQLIAYRENITDRWGQTSTYQWTALSYYLDKVSCHEEIRTDALGNQNRRSWNGNYDKYGRLIAFNETQSDSAGGKKTLERDLMAYDDQTRLVSYRQRQREETGFVTESQWTASRYDSFGRLNAYIEKTVSDGDVSVIDRRNITYDDYDRVRRYEEEVYLKGVKQTRIYEATSYAWDGQVSGYLEESIFPDRSKENKTWKGRYDTFGRLVDYEEICRTQTIDGLSADWRKSWRALKLDGMGRAVHVRENVDYGQNQVRWTETIYEYGAGGRIVGFIEKSKDQEDILITNVRSDIRYDDRGRLTDYVQTNVRSDQPDLTIKTVLAGRRYDASGLPMAGIETIITEGEWRSAPTSSHSVKMKVEKLIEGLVMNRSGEIEGYTQITRTNGSDEYGQLINEEEILVVDDMTTSSRRETMSHRVGQNVRVQISVKREILRDIQGNVLSLTEETWDPQCPQEKSIVKRSNMSYGPNGENLGYREESSSSRGSVTIKDVYQHMNSVGQLIYLREMRWQGDRVEINLREKYEYDLKGRSIKYAETAMDKNHRTEYRMVRENLAWNDFGMAVRYVEKIRRSDRAAVETIVMRTETVMDDRDRESSTTERIITRSDDGHLYEQTDVQKTGIQYDSHGRMSSYHENVQLGGDVVSHKDWNAYEFDSRGRVVSYGEKGYTGVSGDYDLRKTSMYDEYDHVICYTEEGMTESGGCYSARRTLDYDSRGRLTGWVERRKNDTQRETEKIWSVSSGDGYDEYDRIKNDTVLIRASSGVETVEERNDIQYNEYGQIMRYGVSKQEIVPGCYQTVQNGVWRADVPDDYTSDGQLRHFVEEHDYAVSDLAGNGVILYRGNRRCVTTDSQYDVFGRRVSWREDLSENYYDSNGILIHVNDLQQENRTQYDEAGRAVSSSQYGRQNGQSIQQKDIYSDYDEKGRARCVMGEGDSASDGKYKWIKRNICYDEEGRTISYDQEGIINGESVNRSVRITSQDILGRILISDENGFGESGRYRKTIEMEYDGLNRVVGRMEKGFSAVDGDYESVQTDYLYGFHSELIGYTKTLSRPTEDILSQCRIGYDSSGKRSQQIESAEVYKDGVVLDRIKSEWIAIAYDDKGELQCYETITERHVLALNEVQTITQRIGHIVRDDYGRIVQSMTQTGTVLSRDGTEERSMTSCLRLHGTYYSQDDQDADASHLKNRVSGYTEIIMEDLSGQVQNRIITGIAYSTDGIQINPGISVQLNSQALDEGLILLKQFADRNPGAETLLRLSQLASASNTFIQSMTDWLTGRGLKKGMVDVVAVWLNDLKYNVLSVVDKTFTEEDRVSLSASLQGAVSSFNWGRILAFNGSFKTPDGLQISANQAQLTIRSDAVLDEKGRELSWRERQMVLSESLTECEQNIEVTYNGDSRNVETYSIRARTGDTITHTFRDGFQYDSQNRPVHYREVTFEGDLLEAGREKIKWNQLSAQNKVGLLNDIQTERIQPLGAVRFRDYEYMEYDAKGRLSKSYGTDITRGYVLSSLSEVGLSPESVSQLKGSALALIESETKTQLSQFLEPLSMIDGVLAQLESERASAEVDWKSAVAETERIQSLLSDNARSLLQVSADIVNYSEVLNKYRAQTLHGVPDSTGFVIRMDESGNIWKETGGRRFAGPQASLIVSVNDSDEAAWQTLTRYGETYGSQVLRDIAALYMTRLNLTRKMAEWRDQRSGLAASLEEAKRSEVVHGSALKSICGAIEQMQGKRTNIMKDYEVKSRELKTLAVNQYAKACVDIDEIVSIEAKMLSESILDINGITTKLSEKDAVDLLNGRSVDIGGALFALQNLHQAAKIRMPLNQEEHFLQIGEHANKNRMIVQWQGSLSKNGRILTEQEFLNGYIHENGGITKSSERIYADCSDQTLGLIGDGRMIITHMTDGPSDKDGRSLSQTADTLEIVRQGGQLSQKHRTQDTTGYRYNGMGQVTGYHRVTRDGAIETIEWLLAANYDVNGRVIHNDVKIAEKTADMERVYRLQTTNISFDTAGRVLRAEQIRTEGDNVIATRDMSDRQYDKGGQLLFSRTQNIETSREEWVLESESCDWLVGDIVSVWNMKCDARGNPTKMIRMTEISTAETAFKKIENISHSFDSLGRLSESLTETTEFHISAYGTAVEKYQIETDIKKYDISGLALQQKSVRIDSGARSITEDTADRIYDRQGRLLETQTVNIESAGQRSDVHWKALQYDSRGRVVQYDKYTRTEDGTVHEKTLENIIYDGDGRIFIQNVGIEEYDATGKSLHLYSRNDKYLGYGVSGDILQMERMTEQITADGIVARVLENHQYRYDEYGRVLKTAIRGYEETDGQRRYYDKIQEILVYNENGNARRSRSSESRNGVTTTRVSLEDIEYDKKGRIVFSRDCVEQAGEGYRQVQEESISAVLYDGQNRKIAYVRMVSEGGLETTETVSNITYDSSERIASMQTQIQESSVIPGLSYQRQTSIEMRDMAYDSRGDLIHYEKTVREGGLETRHHSERLFYDERGRLMESLLHVMDNTGRNEYEWSIISRQDSLGRAIESAQLRFEYSGTLPSSSELDRYRNVLLAVTGVDNGFLRRIILKRYEIQGFKNAEITKTTKCKYDVMGRAVSSESQQLSLAWDRTGKIIQNKTVYIKTDHQEYDPLNRLIAQTSITRDGSTQKTEFMRYQYAETGRVERQTAFVRTEGLNGDGSRLFHECNQTRQYEYDAMGRVVKEIFHTYNESLVTASPQRGEGMGGGRTLTDTLTSIDIIVYDDNGRRAAWKETVSSSASPGMSQIRVVDGAQYDNAGRLKFSNEVVYEKYGDKMVQLYFDENATRSYDVLGRVMDVQSDRHWTSSPGGHVAGLDDGWTSGRVKMITAYDYGTLSDGLKGMTVTAVGTGSHQNVAVQNAGINLAYEQKNIRYTLSGQIRGYAQTVSQVEYYEYQKVIRRGISKKTRGGARVEMVTTISDVQILAYDAYGRQTQTVINYSRNDFNNTTGITSSIVREFDSYGRALRVDRVTETSQNLGRGNNVRSGRCETAILAYDESGHVDSARTRTNVLDTWQVSNARGSFDKTMKVADVSMKVAQVAGTVLTFVMPPAGVAIGAVTATYNTARMGVSTHDLGIGGRDRAGARQRAYNLYCNVAAVGLQVLGSSIKMKPVEFASLNAGVQMTVAKASGADMQTTVHVGAISFASGYLQGGASGASFRSRVAPLSSMALAGLGETAIQFSGNVGDPGKRETLIMLGSALKGGAYGLQNDSAGVVLGAVESSTQRLIVNYYERAQPGGFSDEKRALSGMMITAQTSNLIGAAVGSGIGLLFKALKTQRTVSSYPILADEQYDLSQAPIDSKGISESQMQKIMAYLKDTPTVVASPEEIMSVVYASAQNMFMATDANIVSEETMISEKKKGADMVSTVKSVLNPAEMLASIVHNKVVLKGKNTCAPIAMFTCVITKEKYGKVKQKYYQTLELQSEMTERTKIRAQEQLPRYGNWGGRGWSGANEPWFKPPMDSLDEAFMYHDYGYMRGENEKADRELVKALKALPDDPKKWEHPPKNEIYAYAYRKAALVAFQDR